MPIISPIERKTWSGRLLVLLMYAILVIGGVTTVYPFLLMLRLSTADTTDRQSLAPAPEFWFNRTSLARKYILRKHGNITLKDPEAPEAQPLDGPEWSNANYRLSPELWKHAFGPFDRTSSDGLRRQLADYHDFLAKLDERFYESVTWHADPSFETFEARQRREHPERSSSQLLFLVQKDMATRDWHPQWDDNWNATVAYLRAMPPKFRRTCRSPWTQFLKDKYGQFDVNELNKSWGTRYAHWTEIRMPVDPPTGAELVDYKEFVTKRYPHLWTRVRGNYDRQWLRFLTEERRLTPDQWKGLTGIAVGSMSEVRWQPEMPQNDAWATVWCQFVHAYVPYEGRIVTSPDRLFAEFLRLKYESLPKLGEAWGMPVARWGDLVRAERLADYVELTRDRQLVATSMTTGPYRHVMFLLAGESQAILNTVILVLLSLVAALTVNPLAAYALSRFTLRGTHKVLLFFLATMALPGEIAMVPSFLLVRDLGLMNSFFALVLPAAASGFGVFLLKGFFDSLPQELFEAATLDGAKELTIFFRIMIPLAKPILAVTALGAVLGAYGTFLGAVLYLPDVAKWPLMPRLYDLTSNPNAGASYAVAMAGLVIASLPTLVVFLFAQRMIMRGIVLPTMK